VRTTKRNTKLLLVIDETEASKRAVTYVARIVARLRDFHVCVAHTLPFLPTHLTEYGGARNPAEEEKLKTELHAGQVRWIAEAKEKAQPALDRACATLHKAGLGTKAIETKFCFPAEGAATGDEILALARAHKYHTVVIGRGSLSWWRQLVNTDPVEELVRRGKGFTIWIVE
jgi:nucleotide-binding universal stress UspA family protein